MEAIAIAKFQRYSPRKVDQVLSQIRRKTAAEAFKALPFVSRRAARVVEKTLKSAVANLAVKVKGTINLNQAYVSSAWVGQGPALKRVQPGPMGRAMPFKHKMCHITVIVSDKVASSRDPVARK